MTTAIRTLKDGRFLWTKVQCGCGQIHTWEEYMMCEKEPMPEVLRWSLRPRGHEDGVYHVTELINPRYAYYERTQDFTDRPDDKMHFFVGKAIHIALQENFPAPYRETPVKLEYDCDGEKITLVGHIDAADPRTGIMWELKSISSTLWRHPSKFGVDKHHVWQVSAYWDMYQKCYPKRAKLLHEAKIAYLSKSREYKVSPWMEYSTKPDAQFHFDLIHPPLEERTKMLHRALRDKVPPTHLCDDIGELQIKPYVTRERYPCKGCKFRELCAKEYEAARPK